MLAEIESRLEAAATPPLKSVAGAAEFAAAARNAPPRERQPAAFVIPLSETAAGPNHLINAVRQQVAARVGVVLALGNLGDPRGAGASRDLEAVRAAVRAALLGWAPGSADDPLTFARGAAVAFSNNVLWWLDEYQSGFTISG